MLFFIIRFCVPCNRVYQNQSIKIHNAWKSIMHNPFNWICNICVHEFEQIMCMNQCEYIACVFLCLLSSRLLLAITDSKTSFAHLMHATGGGEGGECNSGWAKAAPGIFLPTQGTDRQNGLGTLFQQYPLLFWKCAALAFSFFLSIYYDVVRETESLTCTQLPRPSPFITVLPPKPCTHQKI